MKTILDDFLSFFVPLFLIIIYYWYISIPLIALLVLAYVKSKHEGLRRALRIFLAFVILAAMGMLVVLVGSASK